MMNRNPQITLVGAGCHDSSWLTLAAAEALAGAEAVVCDDLVDESVLALAEQAAIFRMGKRGHRKSADQNQIHALLIRLSRQYSRIVRLQGGDPMIFGRGMEEIESLQAHGIEVRIIPGISSFYGIPAKEQLALTRRDVSRGFLVTTAHFAQGDRTETQWKAIAEFEGTRVFLMGMNRIESIADHLIEAGLDPDTPSAVLTSPVMTATASVYAPLEQLASAAEKAGLQSPGIILIGGTVCARPGLDPVRIGLVCTQDLQSRIRSHLPARFQLISLADIKQTSLSADWTQLLGDWRRPSWIVLTSRHGVSLFFETLRAQKIDLRSLHGIQIACIGSSSARALEDFGLQADLVPETASSVSLARALLKTAALGSRILLLQSRQADPILAQILSKTMDVLEHPLYSSHIQIREDVSSDWIVFGSLEEARAWKKANAGVLPLPSRLLAISQRVAKALKGCSSFPVLTSKDPSAASLAEALLEAESSCSR